jgi:membrane protease YdiL (CAAX protease family)
LYTFNQVKSCTNCFTLIKADAKFCPKCGYSELQKLKQINEFNSKKAITRVSIYYIVLVLVISTYSFVLDVNFQTSLIVDFLLSVFTIALAFTSLKEMLPLYSISNIRIKPLLFVLLIPLPFAFIVEYLISGINNFFDVYSGQYYDLYAFSNHPILYSILFVAIQPAIFEEMAFRGFMISDLIKFTNKKTVIIVTTILFGFVHFSPISLFWMLPMGWALATLRLKYNTLWYGMIFHFLHNLTIVLIEIYNLSLYS